MTTNISWSATKVPFLIGDQANGDWFNIDSTGLLTLASNVTLKFFSGGYLAIAQGATLSVGTGDVFTSIRDDAHGGDTNADGNATSAAATDWNGITVNSVCTTFMTEYYETCQ